MTIAKRTQTPAGPSSKASASAPPQDSKDLGHVARKAALPSLSRFAHQVYVQVKARLENEIEGFLEDATLEESRFMIEVLNDRSQSLVAPRFPGEYEIPLFSAIQKQLEGYPYACVIVPDQGMVPQVEKFIAALEKKSTRARSDSHHTPTEEEARDRFAACFRGQVELFARDAGRHSLVLMRDILARWNEMQSDPEMTDEPNLLAAAAELELDSRRAAMAAKEVF